MEYFSKYVVGILGIVKYKKSKAKLDKDMKEVETVNEEEPKKTNYSPIQLNSSVKSNTHVKRESTNINKDKVAKDYIKLINQWLIEWDSLKIKQQIGKGGENKEFI